MSKPSHYTLKLFLFVAAQLIGYEVLAALKGNFSANVQSGCSPLTVQFQDQSNETNLKYYWTFGNGNTSTKANPQAIYYSPGKYKVTLVVTNSKLETSTVEKVGFIEVFKGPTVDLVSNNRTGCVGHEVVFEDKSTKGSGDLDKWLWDFGDGSTSSDENPKHSYKFSGVFPVSLLVIDENGCQEKVLKSKYITIHKTPSVDFTVSKTFSCTTPFSTSFTDKTTNKDGSATYAWTFGDGQSSTAQNPNVTYNRKGDFDVTLTVTNGNGCSSSKTRKELIYIGDIQVDFSASPLEGCVPHEASLISNIKPKRLDFDYTWEHGDGTKSGGFNSLHEYKKAGTYTLKLTVSDNGKCEQSFERKNYIKVGAELKASFTVKDTYSCKVPHLVTFLNTSKGAVKYKWKVESNEYTGQNMTYNFISFGRYAVTLEASNFTGCEDSYTKYVDIQPIKARMKSDKTEGCIPLTVKFTDISFPKEEVVEWEWDFGDGNKSTSKDSVSHTFVKSGVYKVKLKIKTVSGCEAETDLTIKAGVKLEPKFKPVQDTFCNGNNVFFENQTNTDTVKPVEWNWMWKQGSSNDNFSNSRNGNLYTDHDTGWYDVVLIANHNGCISETQLDSQFYIPAPNAKFDLAYDTCKTDTVVLLNTSLIGTDTYWKFSDGSKDRTKKINYFPKPNKIIVSVYAEDTVSGCTDEAPISIPKVDKFVSANFSISGSMCSPTTLTFTASKRTSDFDYQWFDENGILDSIPNFSKDYQSPGKHKIRLFVKDKLSKCEDSSTRNIEITGPGVQGKIKAETGCVPLKVELTTLGQIDTLKEIYWLVNGTKVPVSKAGTITHTVLHPGKGKDGEVSIQLVGIDSNGCSGTEEFSMNANGPKNIDIGIGRFKSCTGQQFIFSPDFNGADQKGYTYKWLFGDGDSSSQNVVNHTYINEGKYLLQLFVVDSFGCTSQWQDSIDIEKERLFADLSADSITTDCPPHFVQFYDRSTSPNREIVSWDWDFGDGVKSKLRYPAHNYLVPGNYSVKLKIVDSWGCEDSVEYPNLVLVNGPRGDYSFIDQSGCVPVEIDFKSTQKDAVKWEWDYGDGVVDVNATNPTHTYQDTGRFIPLLVLTDTFGCTYTLPPIDTIYVYPFPEAGFDHQSKCSNEPVLMVNTSKGSWGDTRIARWDFGDGTTDSVWQPSHLFPKRGQYTVRLEVETEHGCADTVEQLLDLKGIEALFSTSSDQFCLGNSLYAENKSISDTSLNSVQWEIDGLPDSGSTIQMQLSKVGPVKIKLMVVDDNGCTDTLTSTTDVVVGDTVPPPVHNPYRVTVEDDFSTLIEYPKSNIADFKAYHLYRYGAVNQSFTFGDREQIAYTDKGLNTLDNVYCYLLRIENTCGKLSDSLISESHCSVEAEATGGINHVQVDWNHYTGWNVSKYVIHREMENSPGLYASLDTIPGSENSYIDSGIFCNKIHYYKIEALEDAGNTMVSFSDTCAAKPIYLNVVPPNSLVRATVEDDLEILFEWLEAPEGLQKVKGYIVEKSIDGQNYMELGALRPDYLRDEIDEDVEVDDRSYYYRMKVVDVCDDTSEYSNLAKTILLKASTGDYQRPKLNWSKYQGWASDVEYYEVEIEEQDGSFTSLGFTQDANDTFWLDKATDLNQRPSYCYRVIGYKKTGPNESQVVSVSNVDCAPVESRLYVPNAFTPNGDGLNDVFKTPGIYIKEYNIKIFDRWGELIFESDDMYKNWNGRYKGELSELEAYMYVIESVGVDGIKRSYKGTVNLIR